MKYILSILVFFSHEIGTDTAAEDMNTKDVATEENNLQQHEVNDIVAKMPEKAETQCKGTYNVRWQKCHYNHFQ